MSDSEKKRRKLRLSNSPAKNSALLYNFDSVNHLLQGNERMRIDTSTPSSSDHLYEYFGGKSWLPPKDLKRFLPITKKITELPRLRRRIGADPLPDHVYETFHRRMKKDEKSRTATDRERIYFEMDHLKSQLELLRQYDWVKYLPLITVIKDRSDVEELAWKKRATMAEIEKTLAKFANWELRSAQLASEIKAYENRALSVKSTGVNMSYSDDYDDDDDDDDDSESILAKPLDFSAQQRRQRRVAKHGQPFKILLGNGFVIRFDPYMSPPVAIEAETS